MNFNKAIWTNHQIGDVAYEVSERVENPSTSHLKRFVGLEEFESGQFKIRKWTSTENLVSAMKLFKSGNVLFARRNAYLRRSSQVDFDGVCSGDAIVLNQNGKMLDGFLTLLLNTNKFWEYAIANAAGTMSKRVKWRDLSNYSFLLPSKIEQEKILSIFQTFEKSIEQAEEQEKNLRVLAKRLIDGLISDAPTFGNLLKSKELAKVKFADVTACIEQHERQPLNLGLDRFVGLENIEPENFRISTWGNIEDGTTFTKTFASGDVLFCKRRSYLKKVAIAEFDGICSSDILVFRAKENKMLAELLPFYAASESFIQYAVNTSAGSLSPRTKWRDLAKFEVHIPDLETQAKILEVLQQVQTTIEQTIEQKETLKNLKFKLLNEILG